MKKIAVFEHFCALPPGFSEGGAISILAGNLSIVSKAYLVIKFVLASPYLPFQEIRKFDQVYMAPHPPWNSWSSPFTSSTHKISHSHALWLVTYLPLYLRVDEVEFSTHLSIVKSTNIHATQRWTPSHQTMGEVYKDAQI